MPASLNGWFDAFGGVFAAVGRVGVCDSALGVGEAVCGDCCGGVGLAAQATAQPMATTVEAISTHGNDMVLQPLAEKCYVLKWLRFKPRERLQLARGPGPLLLPNRDSRVGSRGLDAGY